MRRFQDFQSFKVSRIKTRAPDVTHVVFENLETLNLETLAFYYLHQMRHLFHHAANGRRIRTLDNLVEPRKTQPFDDQFMFYRGANRRAHPLDVHLPRSCFRCRFRCHPNPLHAACVAPASRPPAQNYSSSAFFPRRAATASLFFNFFNASKVALITLCGFVVPMDFVSTF